MSQEIIEYVNSSHVKDHAPQFRIGDTVDVHLKIREGEKERIQVFNGVVIARKGQGTGETFTVRRIVANEGVERTFLLHSPFITKVEVLRSGKVRRAKLYYLRERIGKARRLREKRVTRSAAPAEAANASEVSTSDPESQQENRELAGAQL